MNMEDVEARLRYFSHVIFNKGAREGANKSKLKQKVPLFSISTVTR